MSEYPAPLKNRGRLPARCARTLMLLVLLATLALQLPSFDEPFVNDLGDRAYGSTLILEGYPIYTVYHPTHQLPATYYVYALALKFFGLNYFAFKVWTALAIVVEVALLYALGKRMGGMRVGLVGAYLFALFTSDPFMEGTTAQTELPANLPRILSVLFLWLAVHQDDRRRRWCLLAASGAASMVAFWFKASYAAGLGTVAVAIVAEMMRQPGTLFHRVRRIVGQYAAVAAGCSLVVALVVVYFATVGALPGLVQVFTMGFEYIKGRRDAARALFNVLVVPVAKLVLELWLLLSLALFAFVIWWRKRMLLHRVSLVTALWILFSFVEANASLYPFRHYDLLIVPALSLAAAFAVAHLSDLGSWSSPNAVGAALMIAIIPLSICFRTLEGYSGPAYYKSFAAYKLGWIDRSEYLVRATGSYGTAQERIWLNERGLDYEPDLVILNTYLNDSQALERSWALVALVNNFAARHSAFYVFFQDAVRRSLVMRAQQSEDFRYNFKDEWQSSAWISDSDTLTKLIQEADQDWGLAWDSDELAIIESETRQIAQAADERDIAFLIVLFPVNVQVYAQVDTPLGLDRPQKRLVEFADEQHIPVLDLLPLLRSVQDDDLYYDQCHLKLEAHQIVASEVYKTLQEYKLVELP